MPRLNLAKRHALYARARAMDLLQLLDSNPIYKKAQVAKATGLTPQELQHVATDGIGAIDKIETLIEYLEDLLQPTDTAVHDVYADSPTESPNPYGPKPPT